MTPHGTRLEELVYRLSGLAIFVAIAATLIRVYQVSGAEELARLIQLALSSLVLVGKYVIFLGLHEDTPSPWVLAIMVWLIDLVFAFVLSSGLETLERARMTGRWLRNVRRRATLVFERYPRLERMAFFGVVLFVALPLLSTGAIAGAFASRLCGLSRLAAVLAIALGSAITASLFAVLAQLVGQRAEDALRSPISAGISLTLLIVVGRLIYTRLTERLKRG